MIALIASMLVAANASAHDLVMNCRTMIPANVELEGRIILRNRKGFVQSEYNYRLVRNAGQTSLELKDDEGRAGDDESDY